MRIIPVIDLKGRVVVHGVGGRRGEYRPIVSKLTPSIDPAEIARVFVREFGPREIYLADLDAIGGALPALDIYQSIRALGVRLWVDAGVTDDVGARSIAELGCDVIASLESAPSEDSLQRIVGAIGPEKIVFSLDLRNGRPVRRWKNTDSDDQLEPVRIAVGLGVTCIIVLDLARVGTGSGLGTEETCKRISQAFPHVDVIAGGGSSGMADIENLKTIGVGGVLVASALHDGRLSTVNHY